MRKLAFVSALFLLSAAGLAAQYGSAENGYYPSSFHGTVFTGTVTSANDETREVILSYTNPKNGKSQTFVGVLEEGYTVENKDGSHHVLKPSEIRSGAPIKVYFTVMTKKVAGKKTTVNTIFQIRWTPNGRQ